MNSPSPSPAAAPTPPGARNQGHVVAVRGTVVDVWFAHELPAIYAVLRTTAAPLITVEVATQPDDHTVRGISLDPTQGLARGCSW